MARLFLAVWPPPSALDMIRLVPRPNGAPVRWVADEAWHITLRFIGEADHREVSERLDHARLPQATARLGPAVGLLGNSVVMVPVAGLDVSFAVPRFALVASWLSDQLPESGLTRGEAHGYVREADLRHQGRAHGGHHPPLLRRGVGGDREGRIR
ncbi:MAG: hypothetical protein GY713_16460 [Actinomycetia bacterium]|nr:hypothetical protein [Actinomycetes bacterium]